ncbi:hypothetical protein AB0I53_27865 [Saccharopolyspora sp. NPDC050389]|uniref:hypothetical protein n=1 Tax=Saccharopolyspora sp. NPDC050389 TaxID=3155516 RepID=UPI00340D38CC
MLNRTRRWWGFRGLITAASGAYLLQAVLAGQFLSGTYASLGWHQITATCTDVLLVCAIAVAASLRWPDSGRWWPLLTSAGLFLASQVQTASGAARLLAVHVPLAVLITIAAVVLTVLAWREPVA